MRAAVTANGKEYIQPVIVEWQDACYQEYLDAHSLSPIPVLTFGVILEQDATKVSVACEIYASESSRHIMTVPKHGSGMAPRIHKLPKLYVPTSFVKYRKSQGLL